MAGKLNGKVAIVTGASSGIGKATAIAFAREGALVAVAARRESEGEETVREIREAGGEATFVKTDVSRASDVEALVNRTLETYGRLDCAFNNAGIGIAGPLTDLSEEEWDRLMDVNLKGTWLCLKYQIPAMLRQGGGAIVNMASITGVVGFPGISVYAATKGGVIALSRSAALECAKSGVRINSISPGLIETDMVTSSPAEWLAQMTAAHPVGRMGKVEEVAEAVVWLCSDAASFVTGHNMIIDGGYTAQ
jgi:NAD(P)-dependent dehydrogenase (short-subunit alcohol dehydrogenase family)